MTNKLAAQTALAFVIVSHNIGCSFLEGRPDRPSVGNQYRVSGGEACGIAAIASLERLKNAKAFFNNNHLVEQCVALQQWYVLFFLWFFSFFGAFLAFPLRREKKEMNTIKNYYHPLTRPLDTLSVLDLLLAHRVSLLRLCRFRSICSLSGFANATSVRKSAAGRGLL